MTDQDDPTTIADAELVLRSRSGDCRAFAELWRRHYRSGVTVARNLSTTADPDDLVQEAYTRIFHSIRRGGGPTGSFRAYLFTIIRNTAVDWGRSTRETSLDELEALEDPATNDRASDESLDRSLSIQAFRSLPARWQEVLWYSEIEDMKPAQIAPLLGLKPTAVAQLAFRAREGLREAWVQAHLGSVAHDTDCAWAITRLAAYARDNLGRRDRANLDRHLASCPRCTGIASEAERVSSRLALVLLPLTVGAGGAAGYLATVHGGAPAIALAAMPSAVVEGAAAAGTGTGMAVSGAGAGSAAVGASAGAMASGAGGVGGIAAGSALVGAAATGTSGAVAGGLGIAAAAIVVAGTVAAMGAPAPASETALAPTTSASAAPSTPAEALVEAADSSPLTGPSPSDIPDLGEAPATPVPGELGGTIPAVALGASTAGSGDADPTGNVDAGSGSSNGGGNPNGAANGKVNGSANGTVKADTGSGAQTSSPVGSAGNGNGSGNAGNGSGSGSTGNGSAFNDGGNGRPGLAAGSPALVSSTSSTAAGATVVEVVVSGTPGASVEARIRGTIHASATIAADGRAVLVLHPTAQDVSVDARVDLRYVDGSASGPPLGIRLSALV